MNVKTLTKQYKDYSKLNNYYQYCLAILNFENQTIAPAKSVEENNHVSSYFSFELFKRQTSSEYKELILALKEHYTELDDSFKRIVDLEYKSLQLNEKIPPEEMKQYQEDCANAYTNWVIAKNKNDYNIYKPYLKKVMNTNIQFGKYYGLKDGSSYNTFIDMYEEGMSEKRLDTFFEELKACIVPLLKKIISSNVQIKDQFLYEKVKEDKQLKMGEYIAKTIGYDLNEGMILKTEHPFTSRIGQHDVRLTTHLYENNFTSNLFSIAHEGGHGIYEQNLDPKYYTTPLYEAASMAFHESQSRFYENIIGKSEAFTKLVYPKIQRLAGKALKNVSVDEYYQAINKVQPSLIRTEADELTYCLHIIIRYEIEKMIMQGKMDYDQLPSIWNQKYKEYLGIDVPSDQVGVLQDVHWTSGVGYFFSYAVGNAYSAQIYHAMKQDLNVDELIANNQLKVIKKWLKEHIYQYGSFYSPTELIVKISGEELNSKYYCDYLVEKFSKIYHLK